jgi:hypothetical protein
MPANKRKPAAPKPFVYSKAIIDRLQRHLDRLHTGRKNPAEDAATMFEIFHGQPPEEVIEVIESMVSPRATDTLGDLLELWITPAGETRHRVYDGFGDAKLASNAEGTQLYIVGGDQSVDISEFGIEDTGKDLEVLGDLARVVYSTAKFHLGKADRKIGPYEHKLGEESGRLPTLLYDVPNQKLMLAGGSYVILQDMGAYSAGIRD